MNPIPTPASTPINVVSFGAKGDGMTDNSRSIQRALDSFRDGGALFFPAGRYVFGETIILPSNVRILGDGKRSTSLIYQGVEKAFVSGDRIGKYGTGSYYITLEDLAIRGANGAGTGLYLTSRYLTISNTEITHFGTGIDCQFCWTNKFHNVSFFYNQIAFKGGSFLNANSFVNCIFSTGRKAVTFTQGANISFIGCQFEGYSDACFSFRDKVKAAICNLHITGCYFENGGKCIDVGPNCSFSELSLSNSSVTTHGGGPAIAVDNAKHYGSNTGLVENNTFYRDNHGAAESFVHLEGPAYLIFRNNKGYATPDHGNVALLDEETRLNHTSSIEEDLTDANRLNFSGVGFFKKGVMIGGTPPALVDQGLLIADHGKLKYFLDATHFEYLLAGKAGPGTDRPKEAFTGMVYFDTALNQPVWWNGSQWVDAGGRSV